MIVQGVLIRRQGDSLGGPPVKTSSARGQGQELVYGLRKYECHDKKREFSDLS
jgi:hypothetical protein